MDVFSFEVQHRITFSRCDLEKHIAQIAVYQAAIDKLNSGQIAKADHGGFKDSIDKMKCELDATRKLRRATSGQRGNARTLARLPATSSTEVIPETDGAPKTVTEPRGIPGGS